MAVNSKKKQVDKAAKRAREDRIYTQILCAFAVCILLELVMISLYRTYASSDAYALEYYLKKLWWLCLIPGALCAGGAVLAKKRSGKVTLPVWGAILFVVGGLCLMLAGWYRHNGAKAASILLPVAAVLLCVYFVYQREFFMTALSFAGTIFALWLFRRSAMTGLLIAMLVLAAVFAVWTMLARHWGGRLWKKGPRFFRKDSDWAVLMAAYILSILALVGALVFGAAFAYAAMFAVAVLIFVAAVYYTVRML